MNNNSIWEKNPYPKQFEKLNDHIKTDLLIIGAGMAGLSVAYEMQPYTTNITIVDENRIYQGTTSSTTAKVTYQHGFIYHNLIKTIGLNKAKEYYNFNNEGLKRTQEIIEKEKIDCDFQLINGYLYALKECEEANVDLEYQAYQKIGIPCEITNINEKITKYKALKTPNQANFNISKYMEGLTNILLSNNVKIYEDTRIVDVNFDVETYAKTIDNFTILAKNIIICSHYPIYKSFNFYFTKMMPKFSYSIVSEPVNLDLEDANYINTTSNPTIAIRYIKQDDNLLLNISGATHDAKKFKQTLGQINQLKAFGENHFGITEYPYTWCNQDYTTADYVPLVGRLKDSIYLATSYNKWGMAASTASAIVIKDLIQKNTSEFSDLLKPTRFTCTKKFFKYNFNMIFTYFKTKKVPKTYVLNIPANTGKVVKLKSKHVGIYKDENSKLHIVDAMCPHLKCVLRFNTLEKTYDCKCHGSRFTYEGKLIDGPSKRDLKQLSLDDIKELVVEETIERAEKNSQDI